MINKRIYILYVCNIFIYKCDKCDKYVYINLFNIINLHYIIGKTIANITCKR